MSFSLLKDQQLTRQTDKNSLIDIFLYFLSFDKHFSYSGLYAFSDMCFVLVFNVVYDQNLKSESM